MASHDNWYTPPSTIDPIRQFLNLQIGLDPASCIEANKTIQALKYFSLEYNENGLNMSWDRAVSGLSTLNRSVFCNPPYCKGAMYKWLRKAQDEYANASYINEIVLLVNRSDSKEYYRFVDEHKKMSSFGSYYQLRKRIKFVDGTGGEKNSPQYNNDLFYWGLAPSKFTSMCRSAFGDPVPASF